MLRTRTAISGQLIADVASGVPQTALATMEIY